MNGESALLAFIIAVILSLIISTIVDLLNTDMEMNKSGVKNRNMVCFTSHQTGINLLPIRTYKNDNGLMIKKSILSFIYEPQVERSVAIFTDATNNQESRQGSFSNNDNKEINANSNNADDNADDNDSNQNNNDCNDCNTDNNDNKNHVNDNNNDIPSFKDKIKIREEDERTFKDESDLQYTNQVKEFEGFELPEISSRRKRAIVMQICLSILSVGAMALTVTCIFVHVYARSIS
eukprot:Pgem_evm2s13740